MTTATIERLYPLPDAFARLYFHSGSNGAVGMLEGVSIPANYRASKQADGNFTIHDIDVFRATVRTNPKTGAVNKFDEGWMEQAAARFEELRVNGYLPPVHIDHHDQSGASRRFAGNIGRLRVNHTNDGVAEFRADLVNIPPDVMREITAKRLPFRSIEVNNPDVPEVSSLALMATVVPYHKLPLTHVTLDGGEQFREAPEAVMFGEDHRGTLVIVQRFAAPYASLRSPVHFANTPQKKSRNNSAEELDDAEYMDDTTDGGTDDQGEYLSPEELEAMLAPGGNDAEEAVSDFEPDEYELAELQGEGIDMATLAEGLGQIAQAVTEGNKQILAKLEAVGGTGGTPPGSTPPPAGYKADTTNRQTFADPKVDAQGNVTISLSQYHALLAKLDAADGKIAAFSETVDGLVKFKESVEAGYEQAKWEDAIDAEVRGHIERLGLEKGAAEAAYRHAWNFAEASVARGVAKPDLAQFFADYTGTAVTPPKPPKADDSAAPPKGGKPAQVNESQAVKFCEANGEISQAFKLAKKPIQGQAAVKAYEMAQEYERENLAAQGCTMFGQVYGAITAVNFKE